MASLPTSLSSFVGRSAEIERISSLLSSTRLLTLTGPGGAGTAIEAALGLAERGGRAPGETLAAHLADREMLLVLDNFEQI
ncbi:MAG TPA: hypothetical protein VMM78_10340, partial [Thermomicrobiales bacterium]|nr:hypothetical protein [Thermomicrobiales bacterium]